MTDDTPTCPVAEYDARQRLTLATMTDPAMLAMAIRCYVSDTPWAVPLGTAFRAGNSLPWLAFAGWCAENRPHLEAAARTVAAHLANGVTA